MKVVAIISLCSFPLWRQTYDHLCRLCDQIFIRFDGKSGDPEIIQELKRLSEEPGSKIKHVNTDNSDWSCPEWRENCLSLCHVEKPDVVIALDEDEIFDDIEGFKKELDAFWHSDKRGMMFSYNPLISNDGREINKGKPYPPEAHMKVFKWTEGISYWPYHGNAIIGMYSSPGCHWRASTKINHYCAYTPQMERAKHWRSDTPYGRGRKAVTLIGFGPSSEIPMEIAGEVWSLNNCYDQFLDVNMMKRVTRVFEMHQPEKRKNEVSAKDGRPHFAHLNEMGKLGHRIIMQQPHPLIANSESYPLYDVLSRFPFRYFDGTPPYLIAMALLERYNEIRIYGFDQLDWEHRLQRECFVFWVGLAAGAGVAIGGELTFLRESTRLYGYDYGPEFDDVCEKRLWSPFPFQMKMKIPSRAQKGDLFDGVR